MSGKIRKMFNALFAAKSQIFTKIKRWYLTSYRDGFFFFFLQKVSSFCNRKKNQLIHKRTQKKEKWSLESSSSDKQHRQRGGDHLLGHLSVPCVQRRRMDSFLPKGAHIPHFIEVQYYILRTLFCVKICKYLTSPSIVFHGILCVAGFLLIHT